MRTLGIDLAAQPTNTATCMIEWMPGAAVVGAPIAGADDERLLAAMAAADWTGIDAPLGWPTSFADAIHEYSDTGRWPASANPDALRLRVTDRFVTQTVRAARGVSIQPLSVSSDRIAICAWRCASLLGRYHRRAGSELDRTGAHGIVEVYPSATLAMWGLPHRGYKPARLGSADEAATQREAIVTGLVRGSGGWLVLCDEARVACIASDHCLDALVSSIAAAATAFGQTIQPGADDIEAARREGWTHVPSAGSLGLLR